LLTLTDRRLAAIPHPFRGVARVFSISLGSDLRCENGVTLIFNAMEPVTLIEDHLHHWGGDICNTHIVLLVHQVLPLVVIGRRYHLFLLSLQVAEIKIESLLQPRFVLGQ
jgi:hypothetical protein